MMHLSFTHYYLLLPFLFTVSLYSLSPFSATAQPLPQPNSDSNSFALNTDEQYRFTYLPQELETVTDKVDLRRLTETRPESPNGKWTQNDTRPAPDNNVSSFHASQRYVYFPGRPRWARSKVPMNLTYAFSHDNLITTLSLSDIRRTFKRAFSKWEFVIPITFIEMNDYVFADIRIGFYRGEHGDGEPFDGVLGILAHSFSPESGRLHLDSDETWAIDFGVEKSKVAIDLESVAIHEVGHLLGLGHSTVEEAVMYPDLKPRMKKVDLSLDDVKGVQALYGSNPNYTFETLLEYEYVSINRATKMRCKSFQWSILALCLVSICVVI